MDANFRSLPVSPECVQVDAAATPVRHYVGLNRTPALPLAVRGWMALIEADHCSNIIQVTAEQNALVAFVADVAAGVLTYRHEAALKELVVGLGYVLPAYQGLGLYQRLWAALVARAQEVGAVQILSATFLDNAGMRAVARRQGRIERQVILDFTVPPAAATA